jgi:hypothetical protein
MSTRKPINADSLHGPWRVVEMRWAGQDGHEIYQCQCQSCFDEDFLTRKQLREARAGKSNRCKRCRKNGPAAHRARGCHVCEGLSWRRPRVGLCRCGGSFRQETIERPEVQSSSAGFDNVPMTGRRLVGFCTVGEMAPRICR